MGIYDRDYYRSAPGNSASPDLVGRIRMWSITSWLIGLNIAVFVLDNLLARMGMGYVRAGSLVPVGPLTVWGHFSVGEAFFNLQLWRLITFQFLHANLQHLLFNMLGIYFFGQMMETYLGRQRFLLFYLLCGMAGVAMYVGLWAVHVLVGSAWVPLVGASAGIFGILAAAARVAPNATVMLMFPPMPVQLRTWALILLALAAGTILLAGPNAGGEAAHLGGAILGWFGIFHARGGPRMRIAR